MAKKKDGSGNALPGMEDQFKVPEPVQKAADRYSDQVIVHNKAKIKRDELAANLVDIMIEHKVDKVWIRDGQKFITLASMMKPKIQSPKKDPDSE
jgi:hypothetical protein